MTQVVRTDIHTTVYIGSGAKNAMYTLRQSRTGGMFGTDFYLRNLARDPQKAEAKARAWPDVKKIVVLDDRGFKVYGSCPSSVDAERGDRLSFMAKIEASNDDSQFGFFKRPTKAEFNGESLAERINNPGE